jgi:ATP-dependent exoDNAse (exonuclease V) alpha subunit
VWSWLCDELVAAIFARLGDAPLARLSGIDKRTFRLAKRAMKAALGLSSSQWQAFRAVLERRESVLLLGSAGSGKSHLLRLLHARLPTARICASTGAAAEKLDATTLHSTLGMTAQDVRDLSNCALPVGDIADRVRARAHISDRKPAAPLIVDEVSMLTSRMLDFLRAVLRRGPSRCAQLVLCGDPLQLQAVKAKEEGAFHEAALVDALTTFVLDTNFRHADDEQLASILNRARRGRARQEDVDWIAARSAPEPFENAVWLFCTNREMLQHNETMVASLQGVQWTYTTTVEFTDAGKEGRFTSANAMPKWWKDNVQHGLQNLALKIGARVMLTRNDRFDARLFNGSFGIVTEMNQRGPLVAFDCGIVQRVLPATSEVVADGVVMCSRTQLPLEIAFGVSIHKAQGATLAHACVDVTNAFAPSHTYVALSRVRRVCDLHVRGLRLDKLNRVDRAALRFFGDAREASEARCEDLECAEDARFATDPYDGISDEIASAALDAAEADARTH